jgi:hypothetical protein
MEPQIPSAADHNHFIIPLGILVEGGGGDRESLGDPDSLGELARVKIKELRS